MTTATVILGLVVATALAFDFTNGCLCLLYTSFAITMIYARWADRVLDPAAAKLADHMERGNLQ